MGDMEDYGTLRKSQEFQPLLQAFIQKQVQSLLDELALETGTESVVILANIGAGTAFTLGSTYSGGFVETTNFKNEFLSYCMNRYHAGDIPVHPGHLLLNSGKKRKSSPWGPKSKRQTKGPTGAKTLTVVGSDNGQNASVGSGSVSTVTPDNSNTKMDQGAQNNSADDSNMGTNHLNQGGTDSQNTFDGCVTVKTEPLSDGDVSSNQESDTSFNTSQDLLSPGLNNSVMKTPAFGPIRFVRKYPPKERTTLTLPEKILIIEDYESGTTISQRRLADKYNISKSAVADMLKNRQLLKDHYEFNANTKRKRFNTTSRFGEINEMVWQWFKTARENGIQMSGPMIQEKALQVAQALQVTDFKGSNGWLHSWRSRYNVTSYRDENAPPQKQTYINDYSKIEGFNPLNKEMERTNAIMNYGSLNLCTTTSNDSHASNLTGKGQDVSSQSTTELLHSMLGLQGNVSKPTAHAGMEQNEGTKEQGVTDSIETFSTSENQNDYIDGKLSDSVGNSEYKSYPQNSENAENRGYPEKSELYAGSDTTSTSQSRTDESCQSTAYDSIVQNALSEFESNKFAC